MFVVSYIPLYSVFSSKLVIMGSASSIIANQATVEDVAHYVESISPAIAQYKDIVIELGINGAFLQQTIDANNISELEELLVAGGVTSKLHLKLLLMHLKNCYATLSNANKPTDGLRQQAQVAPTAPIEDSLKLPYEQKVTDVFLSHDWGRGCLNHNKVKIINDGLKKYGIKTWFDEEKMTDSIRDAMIDGIEHTNCCVIFITPNYYDKVNSSNPMDNCKVCTLCLLFSYLKFISFFCFDSLSFNTLNDIKHLIV